MESPWTFWKSRKLKKKIYILLPSYCNIAQIQVTVIFKMTFIPNLRSLSSFSSSLQFRVRIRVEAQPSLLKRATIFFFIFFIFSFYLDFVFILSWRATSWNQKIISLQFSYLCFYQSHSYVYYGIPQSSGHSLLPAMIIMIKCPPDENVSSYFAWF